MKLYQRFYYLYRRFFKYISDSATYIGDFSNISTYRQKRQISPPLNFPLLFCCFIYLSTFIFYIVEYLKKGKGKTYEKKVMMSLMLMTFLSAVEGTIVSTAIPRITSDLSGVELVSWVYAIYMLATAVSTPIYGKLADLFGRKKFYSLELQSF